ncbi:FkbM family methyltransferase [Anianabacter salinae]|uniref:FkbM family methyltransferase n=1 Tax=Anianabacter salinae TaxID=2851023 RepID=UPI00225DDD6C|nr:FkbM family methyltransferase [Anianabacter salinae]MBV0912887.1 FkbM family methyltransferase [Anianabacter salinae]
MTAGQAGADAPHIAYDEVIETRGISVPFVPAIITPNIERPMRNNRYEAGECMHLQDILRPNDRVLDLGAGVGLVSSIAARCVPDGEVMAVEANPQMLPLIRETYRINGIGNSTLVNAIAAPKGSTGTAPFYVRGDFWASSMEPDSRPYVQKAEVPMLDVAAAVEDFKPTVICCDIEGGELGLFDGVDLSSVRQIIVELHPKVYGPEGKANVIATIQRQGLAQRAEEKPGSVRVFERLAAPANAARKTDAEWPPRTPRILAATCMKDEGPFILEWVAWHKAMGLTDLYVFTNDCSDGSDALLDRLAEMGELVHLPNPALITDSGYFQPMALAYMEQFRAFREADFFISFDVDEFFNVRVGDGSFGALFDAVPRFDVLSACEINHGSNAQEHYEPGWVTEQFPRHSTEAPGRWKARAGVKSIVRVSERLQKIRNHRPDLVGGIDTPIWLDGSGGPLPELIEDSGENGCDCRGRFNLVSLDHYPLRSLDSYLVKMFRGDVVVKGKRVSERYWRQRNRNEWLSSDMAPGIARAKGYHATFEADAELMRLHRACCEAHAERIEMLNRLPDFKERRDWILRESFEPVEPIEAMQAAE